MSRRQQKRLVAEGVRSLRSQPGWDPCKAAIPTTADRLKQSIEASRVGSVCAEADRCEACLALRNERGDGTALCADHLRRAMGLC